ncbi:MAG: hypothetical protein H6718_27010 [Polyangiaceae bacterium]|nr:hypothetical protein [Myxococcales bacterium]MCB9589093.1 hypothetical protein [Polyangiaceae bacterium]
MASALLPGCRRISKRTLKDTEGRSFEAECDRNGTCKLKQVAGPEAPADKPALALSSEARLVGVCNVSQGGTAAPGDCRAIECSTDTDCPPALGEKDGTCVNHLCISPTGEQGVADAVMMCLAGTGLGRTKPSQVGLYAMALNCGNPCVVPKPCRQP